jgi:hypothetical protein
MLLWRKEFGKKLFGEIIWGIMVSWDLEVQTKGVGHLGRGWTS